MVYGVIYVITNLLTGMKYVGQTTRSVKERFGEHMKSDFLIGRAIRHYGVENFMVEVIEECATPEQLNERERFWIAFFNCMAPNGYNLTDGGKQGALPSAESRKKMSDAKTGVKRSPETVARMSESQKGKTLSPEHRAKLSEANRGRKLSPETRKKNFQRPKRQNSFCGTDSAKSFLRQTRRTVGIFAGDDFKSNARQPRIHARTASGNKKIPRRRYERRGTVSSSVKRYLPKTAAKAMRNAQCVMRNFCRSVRQAKCPSANVVTCRRPSRLWQALFVLRCAEGRRVRRHRI